MAAALRAGQQSGLLGSCVGSNTPQLRGRRADEISARRRDRFGGPAQKRRWREECETPSCHMGQKPLETTTAPAPHSTPTPTSHPPCLPASPQSHELERGVGGGGGQPTVSGLFQTLLNIVSFFFINFPWLRTVAVIDWIRRRKQTNSRHKPAASPLPVAG